MIYSIKASCKKLILAGLVPILLSNISFAQVGESSLENKKNLFATKHETYQVLTQYYRWLLTFEREQTKARIENHMSLLSDSILVVTRDGPLKGKAGMLGFMNYVSIWRNAHHIKSTSIQSNADGSLSLEADIEYQNILPDGSLNAYALHYSTHLKRRQGELPQFTHLTLTPVSVIHPPTFEDAYIENRCNALVYHWMYLVDHPDKYPNALKEIIDQNIQVSEGKKKLSGSENYLQWISKSQKDCVANLRAFKNLKTEIAANGSISLCMDVEWQAIDRKGVRYLSESHHEWILSDNADDAFAKIKEMKITEFPR